MTSIAHIPVFVESIVEILAPQPGQHFLDATFGTGGHSRALLEACPSLSLLCVDRDPESELFFEKLEKDFPRAALKFVCAPYDEVLRLGVTTKHSFHGILADLGISSFQIDKPIRGMSFRGEGPLDLRFNLKQGIPASLWLKSQNQSELSRIFREFGEEPLAEEIAQGIRDELDAGRPLESSQHLVDLISKIYSQKYSKKSTTPPPAKVFQAIRIALNEEFLHLKQFLGLLPQHLAPGGKAAVISFHSLEDRIVKTFFQQEAKDCLCPPQIVTCMCGHKASWTIRKPFPIKPSAQDIRKNPRARSALLRVVVR